MIRKQAHGKDWHFTHQDDEYLDLMLQRLELDSPPLQWCVQFADLVSDGFQGSTIPLSVHDIGCNVGHFCRVLARIPQKVMYLGFDISETYLGIARSRYPEYHFTLLDIETEIPAQQADVSIISATLEHIEKWELALSNILVSTRRLVLIRSFFGTESTEQMYKKPGAKHSYLIRQFTFEEVASLAQSMGFTACFFRDQATDSIPQYLGCGITRTQYGALFKRD